ncbi:hypothetical protein [Corynebacterium epidermidicanis]|uniref:Uncharacterized protein n=1 Tax=Corynebacterium epidermidicanis TaxID=1050174 RepID=A0A0G3GUQ9_9CORY|nr:hypothetical protein [Corynebacterium epidermidicanis]AKK04240.1 hypothetical protein CEPID_12085 [Corynebacterium epidermidicanis]
MTDPDNSGAEGYRFDPELDTVSEEDRHKPMTDLDYMAHPHLREQRNRRSTKQAVWYTVAVCVISILIGVAVAITSKTVGGPVCDAGARTLICSRKYEILFPVLTGGFSLLGVFGAMFILWRKWKKYDRWKPWFGVIWFLIPWALTWITGFGTMAIVGQ